MIHRGTFFSYFISSCMLEINFNLSTFLFLLVCFIKQIFGKEIILDRGLQNFPQILRNQTR